jgi:hypothetical protein
MGMNTSGVKHTAAHDRRVLRAAILVGVALLAGVVGLSACGASGSSSKSSGGSSSAAEVSGSAAGASGSSAATSASAAASGAPSRDATHAAGSASGNGGATAASSGPKLGTSVKAASADVVRTGSVTLVASSAGNLRKAYSGLSSLASANGGFVGSSSLTTGSRPTASLTMQVAESRFYPTMAALTGGAYGKADNSSETGQDVTGQVVNLHVEIANLTSEEDAVRHLLSDAGSVKDILTVQQQLFSLQGQIQQLQAQSASLANQVEYATINVSLTTVAPPPVKVKPKAKPSTPARFWHLASSHSVATVRSVVLAVGWAAPLIVALVVLGGAGLVWRRRHQRQLGAGPSVS